MFKGIQSHSKVLEKKIVTLLPVIFVGAFGRSRKNIVFTKRTHFEEHATRYKSI